MRRSISRTAALALSATLALGAAAVPCAAADAAAPKTDGKLTRLSPASRRVLSTAAPTASKEQPAPAPTSSSAFFKSTRGKVTVALMGAGTGFALWSIQHDRKPVKSPVR